jgi:hypothetical protein
MVVGAFVLFVLGIPNITGALRLLEFVDTFQAGPETVWRSILIAAGFGFLLVGIGTVLLLKAHNVRNQFSQKNRILLLAMLAAFLVTFPWILKLDAGINNEVMVDGITTSAVIVMAITLLFSMVSWVLFSWASKNIVPAGGLLGIISGSSLVIPFLQVLGPMAGVAVGIVSGFVAFMFQKKMSKPERNRPLLVALITIVVTFLVLSALVLISQGSHIWDTVGGIGSWTGTAEGMGKSGFDNIFSNNIEFAFLTAIIPSLVMTLLIIREKNEN